MTQKHIANLLVVLLLAPSLVCAMPACHDSNENQQTQNAAAVANSPHCAERGHEVAAQTSADAAAQQVMLVAECMGVEPAQSPSPFELHSPAVSVDAGDAVDVAFWLPFENRWARLDAIRAPPAEPLELTCHAPVYFATGRLRI